MSVLNRLAQVASNYLRRRLQSQGRGQVTPPGRIPTLPGKPPIVPHGSLPGKPPITGRPPPPPPGIPPIDDDGSDDSFDDIQTFGRGYNFDEDEMQLLESKMRRVSSSNVYSYAYQPETRRSGILYVTFLEYTPKGAGGSGVKGNGPGPTYAYYDFPEAKFKQFERMAESSAGGAVWDYCRVRHSAFEHQHTYALIAASGEYVPRKATADGWKPRALASVGLGRRSARRSQLPAQQAAFRQQLPSRNYGAFPNRGTPNRGAPNRGRG